MIDYNKLENEFLFGLSKMDVLQECLCSAFPGTTKWKSDNPIWNCNVANHLSPKEAWNNEEYLLKAINNLFHITIDSIEKGKYPEFIKRIEKAFMSKGNVLMQEVLNRFTIAKIAPKVTAISSNVFYNILNKTNIDISVGVYCPMAGFGGIIEGAKKWFITNGLNYSNKIEAFDINENFCKYYGWEKRDVLEKEIVTKKIVCVCPPFGLKTERWVGTPEIRGDVYKTNYLTFEEWCPLIRKYVKAPNYIFIGPETKERKNNCGLFSKCLGVQWYPNM